MVVQKKQWIAEREREEIEQMLCPSCNKFAAYDTSSDPELDLEVESRDSQDEAIAISGSASITLTSACCGDELKSACFEVVMEANSANKPLCACKDFPVTSESAEITDRRETEQVKRKPNGTEIRRSVPSRYQRQFYGVHVDVEISCDCGKTKLTAEFDDEIQASGMDELV